MTRGVQLAPPAGAARPSRVAGRVVAPIVEQAGFSALQFSPAVAAALARSGSGLGWTASFTACLGLCLALYRGAAIHPAIRTGPDDLRCSGRAFTAATAALVAVLVPVGLSGAFDNQGTLVVLGCSAPVLGLVDLNRALTADRARIIRTGTLTGVGAVAVAALPLVRPHASPVAITTLWTAVWGALALSYLVSPVHARPGRGVPAGGAWSLTANNLVGQLAANGPLLVVAALLAGDALSELQAARIPLRPMTILAAALPVHYLPHLARNRADRDGPPPGAITIVAVSGGAAAVLAVFSVLVLRPIVESLSVASPTTTALAAVAAVASVAEAVVGLWAVAVHREHLATATRVAALALGLVTIGGLAALDHLDVVSALVTLLVAPTAVSAILSWKLMRR